MRTVIAFFMMVSLLGVGWAYRVEAGEKSPGGEALKIGYVDMGKVIDMYPKARDVENALQKEQEAKQKEMDEARKKINKLEEELKAQESVLKEEEKKKKSRIIEEKKKKWGQVFREYDLEMRNKVVEKQKEVLDDIRQAVETFGRENGYTFILDARQVLYGKEGMEVTDGIVKLLLNKYKSQKPAKP